MPKVWVASASDCARTYCEVLSSTPSDGPTRTLRLLVGRAESPSPVEVVRAPETSSVYETSNEATTGRRESLSTSKLAFQPRGSPASGPPRVRRSL